MNFKLYISLIMSVFAYTGHSLAQSTSVLSAEVDAGASFSKGAWAPSIAYHEEIGTRAIPWLRAGLGLRLWGYYSNGKALHTNESTKSVVYYNNTSLNGLSLVAGLKLHFKRVDIGANTDLIGGITGSNRTGMYTTSVSTRPSNFSVLPGFLSNYSGQSELFVRIRIREDFGVKLGYTFTQLSYVTRNADRGRVFIGNQQRRVHTVDEMPYVALTFSL